MKKILAGVLLLALLISQLSFIQFNNFVYAEDTENPNNTKYHYQQLNDVAKDIYNGIYDMYIQGILQTGTQDYDMAKDNKYLTQ